jgi:hypothetical protein
MRRSRKTQQTKIEWQYSVFKPQSNPSRIEWPNLPTPVRFSDIHVHLSGTDTILTFRVDAYCRQGKKHFASSLVAVNGDKKGSTEHLPTYRVEAAHAKAREIAASQIWEV